MRLIYQITVRLGLLVILPLCGLVVWLALLFGVSFKRVGQSMVAIGHAVFVLKSNAIDESKEL